MIVGTNNHTLEMGGNVSAPSEFRILNSAAAFGILSSGLYSDKITAVAREIICNAYDAHTSVGKGNVPLEIHLPTSLEPFFSVKDQGTGLDHDDMVNLYTTYFATTKGSSNDDIGGFGLGCKSPFAYTSGFTVVSTREGVARSYSAMLNEAGVPIITLMDEEPSHEGNGILVSMPVKANDMWEFRTKTAKVLELFPHFTCNLSDFQVAKTDYSNRGAGWGIRKKSDHLGHTSPRAIVGKVAYRFAHHDLSLNAEQKSILSLPIDLFFNIGELDVTPSRESLSLTKRTVANLKERLDLIHESILDSLREEISNAPSLWFAKLALRDRLQNGNPFRPLVQRVIAKYFGQYQNFVLDEISTQVKITDYRVLTMLSRSYKSIHDSKPGKTLDLKGETNHKGLSSVETSENVVFYMNDAQEYVPRVTKRILEMYRANNAKIHLYLITPAKNAHPATISQEFAKLVNDLGEPEILFTSDLPPVPKQVRGPKAPSDTLRYAWVMSSYQHGSNRDNWDKAKPENMDGDGPFFYIGLDRLEVQSGYGVVDTRNAQQVLAAAVKVGYTVETEDLSYTLDSSTVIFGLNTEGVRRIATNPNWINLFSYIKENPMEPTPDFKSYLAVKNATLSFESVNSVFQTYEGGSYTSILRKHLRGSFLHRQVVLVRRAKQLLNRAKRSCDMFSAWETLTAYMGNTVTVKSQTPAGVSVILKHINLKEVKARYPMLDFVDCGYYRMTDKDYLKTLTHYVKSQDELVALRNTSTKV